MAFAGRSNVGKSTAINAITGRRALARTSKTPGRTRLLNYFELAPGQRLVDLPGYGYAQGAHAERPIWAALIDRLALRQSLCGLMLLVDSRRGISAEDEGLIDWATALLIPVHILLSKADKLGSAERRKALMAAQGKLPDHAATLLFSAQDGTGLEDARRQLERMLQGNKKPR